MMVEAYVPHPTEVHHSSEAEATTTIDVTLGTDIEAHTPHTIAEAPPIDEGEVTTPVETNVITPSSTNSSVHTDGVFPGGPTNTYALTGYVDYVSFRLW